MNVISSLLNFIGNVLKGEQELCNPLKFQRGSGKNGIFFTDKSDYTYPALYDNDSSLWIGANANATRHHAGNTIISAGYDQTNSKGNDSIYVSVPNDDNTNAVSHAVLHNGYEPISPAINITANTGTLNRVTVKKYGKVVMLFLYVQNASAISAGSNVFTGSLSTTALRPATAAKGVGHYNANGIVGTVGIGGDITVRNVGTSSIAANTEVTVGFTYIAA